jgi:hypothetical protein
MPTSVLHRPRHGRAKANVTSVGELAIPLGDALRTLNDIVGHGTGSGH